MSTAPAFDAALAMMLSTQGSENASKDQANVSLVQAAIDASKAMPSAPKVRKARTVQVATEASVEPPQRLTEEQVKGMVVITKSQAGTLDASGFLLALKEAGRRFDANGKPIFVKDEERGDMIKAIDAYIGYDHGGNFASQELAARSQAAREIRLAQGGELAQGQLRSEKLRAQASVKGFVAGMPDARTTTLADWQGRENMAVEKLIELERDAEKATDPQDKSLKLALAQAERERLAHIRRDIASLKGE